MNKIIFTAAGMLISLHLWAQNEFKTYENGLIYSKHTMAKLEHIVDSLNLKYKSCDFNTVFRSKYQAVGHIIKLNSSNAKLAKSEMDKVIDFESFIKKFPQATIQKNVLVVKYQYTDYDKKEIAEFSEFNLSGYGLNIRKDNVRDFYHKPVKNSWIYSYRSKSDYSEESIEAFYFPEEFTSVPLSRAYCRQIGYADCLIDTIATKFKDDAKEGRIELPDNWESFSMQRKNKLLDKMRSTRVIGGCSMDSSPRDHAINIALLSAETTNWEVFLKSHLDIMNDRFERMSDGSYALGQRKTYIKELEELDINLTDLIFGITLRVENPAKNHYYGSVARLGRALTESRDKELFVKYLSALIEDRELDDYNRIIAHNLFRSYIHHIENVEEQKNYQVKLESSITSLPAYLQEKIRINEKKK